MPSALPSLEVCPTKAFTSWVWKDDCDEIQLFFGSKTTLMGWQNGVSPVFFGDPCHSIHGQQKKRPVADKILVDQTCGFPQHVIISSMEGTTTTRYTDCDSQTVFIFRSSSGTNKSFTARDGKFHPISLSKKSKLTRHLRKINHKFKYTLGPIPQHHTSKPASPSCFLKPRKSKPNFS